MYEIRVYGVQGTDIKWNKGHLDFIETAEEQGTIWSLAKFIQDVSDGLLPDYMKFRAYFVDTEALDFQPKHLCYIDEPLFFKDIPVSARKNVRDNATSRLLNSLGLSTTKTTDEELTEITNSLALPYFKYTISDLVSDNKQIEIGNYVQIQTLSYLQLVNGKDDNTVTEKALKWYEIKDIKVIDEDLKHYVLNDGTVLIDDDILFVIDNRLFGRTHKELIN